MKALRMFSNLKLSSKFTPDLMGPEHSWCGNLIDVLKIVSYDVRFLKQERETYSVKVEVEVKKRYQHTT
jgi:hypothetical protein